MATTAPPTATVATHRKTMPMAHRSARASRPGQCQMEVDLRLSLMTSSTDSYSNGVLDSTGISEHGASRPSAAGAPRRGPRSDRPRDGPFKDRLRIRMRGSGPPGRSRRRRAAPVRIVAMTLPPGGSRSVKWRIPRQAPKPPDATRAGTAPARLSSTADLAPCPADPRRRDLRPLRPHPGGHLPLDRLAFR